jgi:hypothetical protein
MIPPISYERISVLGFKAGVVLKQSNAAGCLEDKDYPATAILLALQEDPLNNSKWKKVELELEQAEEQMEGTMGETLNSTIELYSR